MKRLVACLMLILIYTDNSGSQSQKKYLVDTDIKAKVLKDHTILASWCPLSLINQFPSAIDLMGSKYLNYPVDMCQQGEYVFVVDYGLSMIFKFSMNGSLISSFGRRGQGPGEFMRPGEIAATSDGKLCVVDTGRIQIFNSNGDYLSTFKLFNIISDLLIKEQYIYANCIYGFYDKQEKPLILQYDFSGKIIKTFGQRIDSKKHYSIDSQAYLVAGQDKVIVAFKHYPLIRIYAENGDLIREVNIDIKLLKELEKYNYDEKFTNPAPGIINLTRIIAGIQTMEDRIFILLHLPIIEIIEIDYSGNLINTYYSNQIKDIVDYKGFVLKGEKDDLKFFIITSSPEEIFLSVFKPNLNERR